MDHPIQVTCQCNRSEAEFWFKWLIEKGCNAGIYQIGSTYFVFRALEPGEIFYGYKQPSKRIKIEISGEDYIQNKHYVSCVYSKEMYKKMKLIKSKNIKET